jgi:hypothetical protein
VDGDGRGEIVVRNVTTGVMSSAKLDATSKLAFTTLNDPGTNSRVLGVGDFGARGKSDLLFQNGTSGLVSFWIGFDGFVDSLRPLRTVKPGWNVEAVADLDGDGRTDIVWRFTSTPANPSPNPNDNGVVFVWFMKDGVIDEVKNRGGAPVSWTLIGAADLRGVGSSDLIWVSPTNQIRSLTAQANRSFVNELVGTVPAGFTLTRLGDFDGDGKSDLLFRNQQGKLKLWIMNGITIVNQVDLPDSDAGFATWALFAIADLNGDGTVDLIFKKPDNTLLVWLMNKAAPQAPTVVDNAGVAPVGGVAVE